MRSISLLPWLLMLAVGCGTFDKDDSGGDKKAGDGADSLFSDGKNTRGKKGGSSNLLGEDDSNNTLDNLNSSNTDLSLYGLWKADDSEGGDSYEFRLRVRPGQSESTIEFGMRVYEGQNLLCEVATSTGAMVEDDHFKISQSEEDSVQFENGSCDIALEAGQYDYRVPDGNILVVTFRGETLEFKRVR